jgi:hypothetical protein
MYQDEDIYLFINHMKLNVVVESKYLGLIINKTNDGNEPTLLKYTDCLSVHYYNSKNKYVH